MNKADFLERMRLERAHWEALLAEVGPARMELPGLAGDWSARDLVVHVTAYERGLLEWLEAAGRGEALMFEDLDHPDLDTRNALILEQSAGRSLQEVLEEAGRVFQGLVQRVEAIPEGDLLDSRRTAWFVEPRWKQAKALWECIADDSFRHYRQHAPDVRTWLDRQAALVSVPRVGVGVIVEKEGRVLLLRRRNVHGEGTWSTPGGHLELGESPEDCAVREVYEETGVCIADVRFRAITNDLFVASGKHYITIWMQGRYLSGEAIINASYEMSEVGWFPWEALPRPLFLSLQHLLEGRCYPPPDPVLEG